MNQQAKAPAKLRAQPPAGSSVPANELPADPTLRARRKAMHRSDDGEAFLPDPSRRGAHITATDAESFGEEFVASATGGEPVQSDAADEVVEEEEGGPFLELDSSAEADDVPEDKDATGHPGGDDVGVNRSPMSQTRH
jgi:hypothetical protein